MTERHPDLGDPDALLPHLLSSVAKEPDRGLVGEAPIQLELAELYQFKYLREHAQSSQLLAEKHATMARQASQELAKTSNELSVLLDGLGAKYKVDLHTHRITEDGKVVPNPQ